jgi:hypothetical protein
MTALTYNLDTICQRLDIGRRQLLEWLWKHPCDVNGTPFYRKIGRTKLFTETDIARILAALPTPEAPRCPSSSSRRVPATRIGRFAAATSTSNDYTEALALLNALSPRGRSRSSSATSKVAPLPQK